MQHYFLILEMQAIVPLDALVLPKYNTYIERFMKAQRRASFHKVCWEYSWLIKIIYSTVPQYNHRTQSNNQYRL